MAWRTIAGVLGVEALPARTLGPRRFTKGREPMPRYSAMHTSLLMVALLVLLQTGTQAFKPLFPSRDSVTHRDITQKAILRKTAGVCRDLAAAQGWDFSLPIDDSLSASKLQRACSSDSSSIFSAIPFQTSILSIYLSNALVDVTYLMSDVR
ncbi:hypothetical protein DPEC_G00185450 [Dallia pectoralis]|uniref:Uncharacterized protein n=1 Tax=Dallia pectoralis TaxID=75939 RepID=A0ACC2GBD8_DALPE|nr:hypothetical protein DPEC_G00185450 [Dallia pectoralis]